MPEKLEKWGGYMKLKDKTINAASFLENYCKKMCVGKCTGVEKSKCRMVQLLNEEKDVSEEKECETYE